MKWLALHDHLRAGVGLGFEQHRIHVHARRHARGPRLHRLRPADFAAIDSYCRVVGHVLGFERSDPQPASHQCARQPGNDGRFTGVRSGALNHQCRRSHGH
jgi:hypothetical protein